MHECLMAIDEWRLAEKKSDFRMEDQFVQVYPIQRQTLDYLQ